MLYRTKPFSTVYYHTFSVLYRNLHRPHEVPTRDMSTRAYFSRVQFVNKGKKVYSFLTPNIHTIVWDNWKTCKNYVSQVSDELCFFLNCMLFRISSHMYCWDSVPPIVLPPNKINCSSVKFNLFNFIFRFFFSSFRCIQPSQQTAIVLGLLTCIQLRICNPCISLTQHTVWLCLPSENYCISLSSFLCCRKALYF